MRLSFFRRTLWLRLVAGVGLLLALAGCNPKAVIERMTPPQDDKVAREFIGHLIAGRTRDASAMLAPQIQNEQAQQGLGQLVAMFNGDTVKSITVVGVHWNKTLAGQKPSTLQLSYQLELAGGWFAGLVTLTGEENARQVLVARFNPIPASLEKLHAFTFAGKGVAHYVMLPLVVLIPLLCLATFVVCLRSRIRRKWLWALFVIVGLGNWTLNWSTGGSAFMPFYFQLLGASAFSGGAYAPVTLSVGFPLGAVVFLLRRKTLLARAAARSLDPTTPPVAG